MALQKTIKYPQGYEATYHRILPKSISGSSCVLGSYLSKEAREASDNATVEEHLFYIDIPKDVFINGNVFEYLYSKITESKMVKEQASTEIVKEKDALGREIEKHVPIFEDRESNIWADSITV